MRGNIYSAYRATVMIHAIDEDGDGAGEPVFVLAVEDPSLALTADKVAQHMTLLNLHASGHRPEITE